MAQLGIPLRDAVFFDISTYLDIVSLQKQIYSQDGGNRNATQADIDAFIG